MELSSSTPSTRNTTYKILPAKSHDISSTHQKIPRYNNSTHTSANKRNKTIILSANTATTRSKTKHHNNTTRTNQNTKNKEEETEETKNTKSRCGPAIDQQTTPSQITPHHPKEQITLTKQPIHDPSAIRTKRKQSTPSPDNATTQTIIPPHTRYKTAAPKKKKTKRKPPKHTAQNPSTENQIRNLWRLHHTSSQTPSPQRKNPTPPDSCDCGRTSSGIITHEPDCKQKPKHPTRQSDSGSTKQQGTKRSRHQIHHEDTDDDEADEEKEAEEEEESKDKAPQLKRNKRNPTNPKKRKQTADTTRPTHHKRHKRLILDSSDEEDTDNEGGKYGEPPHHSHKGVT
jgi:hypothetical protein